MKEFRKHVLYSIVSAVVFIIVLTLWINPGIFTSTYEKVTDGTSNKISELSSRSLDKEDVSENPSKYLNTNITLSGELYTALIRSDECGIKRNTYYIKSENNDIYVCSEEEFDSGEFRVISGELKKITPKYPNKEILILFEN